MRLTDLIAAVKTEQQDEKRAKLARDREAILRDLRRDLSEEEYQALAAELKPHVEGYTLWWNSREVVIHREGFMERKYTEARYKAGRYEVALTKRIKTGRELLSFLADIG